MKKIVIIICLLTALLPVMAQEFIGCRIDSGWAETPIFLKRISLSDTDFYKDRVFFDLKVASLGYCEVYVNGYYVPDGALHPAVSQLNKRALEVTYDITRFLKKGDNVIQLWIGQGWGACLRHSGGGAGRDDKDSERRRMRRGMDNSSDRQHLGGITHRLQLHRQLATDAVRLPTRDGYELLKLSSGRHHLKSVL